MSKIDEHLDSIVLPAPTVTFLEEKDYNDTIRIASFANTPSIGVVSGPHSPAIARILENILEGHDSRTYTIFSFKTNSVVLQRDNLKKDIYTLMRHMVDGVMCRASNKKFYESIRYKVEKILHEDLELLEILSDYIVANDLNQIIEGKNNQHAQNVVAILNEIVKKRN